MIILLALLLTKHLICDFFMQGPYQYLNKGKYGHPGGILHALNHALGTFLIVLIFDHETPLPYYAALLDSGLHYHIDWAKVNLTKKFNFTYTTNGFWWLLGIDQYLHCMVYLWIATLFV